jgi:hypothetical protein
VVAGVRGAASWIWGSSAALRRLELRRPWVAGAIIGACTALGYVTGILLAPYPYQRSDMLVTAAVGGGASFVVGSTFRGLLNRRRAARAKAAGQAGPWS